MHLWIDDFAGDVCAVRTRCVRAARRTLGVPASAVTELGRGHAHEPAARLGQLGG